jgi:Ca2+-binding EF-hand superfamily protein
MSKEEDEIMHRRALLKKHVEKVLREQGRVITPELDAEIEKLLDEKEKDPVEFKKLVETMKKDTHSGKKNKSKKKMVKQSRRRNR